VDRFILYHVDKVGIKHNKVTKINESNDRKKIIEEASSFAKKTNKQFIVVKVGRRNSETIIFLALTQKQLNKKKDRIKRKLKNMKKYDKIGKSKGIINIASSIDRSKNSLSYSDLKQQGMIKDND